MDRRKTDGRRDRQTLFYTTLPAETNNLSSASDWCDYTKSCFKENAEIFSKNFTSQQNTIILRLK